MRKIIVLTFISLDGVMQAPGGPEEDTIGGFKYGGWTVPYFDEFSGKVMSEQMSRPFDLLLGRSLSFTTLGGKTISMEIPAQFNLKDRFRLKGEGMSHLGRHGRGDLLVDFIVKAPKKVSGKEAKMLEDLEKGL